ncbi:hypothetical protein N9355_09835 [Crocinitomicaceae bacterium]|nr:hypothetical protein [Crocinitomicaceae bacterium]
MKTTFNLKHLFGAFLFASAIFLIPACSADEDPKEEPKQEQVEEGHTLLEERDAFWKEWNDKCAPSTTKTDSSIFKTNGQDYTAFKENFAEVWQEMIDLYQTPEDGEKWLPGIIESGGTYPIPVHASSGQKLYKIVAAGRDIQSPSAYYMTKMQLEQLNLHPAELEQTLGLPLQSCAGEYWIYSITSLVDNNIYFQSTIASTEQYAATTPNVIYRTPGGGVQSLLINNMDQLKWKKADTPDEKYIPDELPKIEE